MSIFVQTLLPFYGFNEEQPWAGGRRTADVKTYRTTTKMWFQFAFEDF